MGLKPIFKLCLKFTKAKYLVMSPNTHSTETLTELIEELNAHRLDFHLDKETEDVFSVDMLDHHKYKEVLWLLCCSELPVSLANQTFLTCQHHVFFPLINRTLGIILCLYKVLHYTNISTIAYSRPKVIE